ncbi:gephyrin-like molybdotransferase Glp [Mangrovibacterium marinum]|uniref:Molybdopterin molybdenumtransferase n=1 Tax=Mangrovibacterium marinum TaxID=1639118 RepID=A0A2T5C4Z2_9BACT|nr:gephyrin-like molybdotransferase Glp [Mangrovibacterium marinum]PTN09932.1 molybdopterin molybdochelatase [Mangrovibacterium marinum]
MEKKTSITLNDALTQAFQAAKSLPTEKISFLKASGRILATDIFADVNMPPFNKSAMDGYACRKEDLGQWLNVREVIPAGKSPQFKNEPGTCSKIMTGAEVPAGADTVFMVEQSEANDQQQIRFTGSKTNSNICLRGEDVKTGDLVLTAGTMLKAQHIAILAAAGCTRPEVYQKPKVGIISTGSELVEPTVAPQASQIRNSNGHQMRIQAEQCACEVNYYGIVADELEQTRQRIASSVNENDVTLLSGGVSVGDFDFVPQIIQQLGFQILFNQMAVKPGKHTTFAINNGKYIIGLPGNPVSSFIQFEIFAKPFLYRLMNYTAPMIALPLPLANDFHRKKADREEYVPVKINRKNEVETISYHGSAHIHAYHQATGFMSIPTGVTTISKGETVHVRPL